MTRRNVNPALRRQLFALADVRGNNPHGTSESADAESRRINAARYETVEQMDRALDRRMVQISRSTGRPLGEVPPAQGGGDIFVGLLALAAGAALFWAFTSKDEDDEEPGEIRENPKETPAPTPTTPAPVVIVMPPGSATPVQPANVVVNPAPVQVAPVLANPAPTNPVVVAPPPPERKRRRRGAK